MVSKNQWWLSLATLALLGGCATDTQAPANDAQTTGSEPKTAETSQEKQATAESNDTEDDAAPEQEAKATDTDADTSGDDDKSAETTTDDFSALPEGTQVALYADALSGGDWLYAWEQPIQDHRSILYYKSDDDKIYLIDDEGPSRFQSMVYGVMTDDGVSPVQYQGYDRLTGAAFDNDQPQPEQTIISHDELLKRYNANKSVFDDVGEHVTATRDAYLSFISALYKGRFAMTIPTSEQDQLTDAELAMRQYLDSTNGGGYPHAEWSKDIALTVNDETYGFLDMNSGDAKRYIVDATDVTDNDTGNTKARDAFKSEFHGPLRTMTEYALILKELQDRMGEDWSGDGVVPPYFEPADPQELMLTEQVALNLVQNYIVLESGGLSGDKQFEVVSHPDKETGEITVTDGEQTYIVAPDDTISTPDGDILHDEGYIGWKNFDIFNGE
ncbi:MAG: hypothetical protein MR008_00485 [Aerococcus sp.]|nr:hypothetical protein [Aerococcus sp.]